MAKISTRFVPIEFRHIDDGKLQQDVNTKFRKMQKRVIDLVKQHGFAVKGATGTVTVTLKIKASDPEHDLYVASGSINETLPKQPPRAKMVNSSVVDDVPSLVIKETIDAETGEIMMPGKF